jgi:hypothetical protein
MRLALHRIDSIPASGDEKYFLIALLQKFPERSLLV